MPFLNNNGINQIFYKHPLDVHKAYIYDAYDKRTHSDLFYWAWQQPQVTRAIELNLGRTKDNVEYVHEGVDEIDNIIPYWG